MGPKAAVSAVRTRVPGWRLYLPLTSCLQIAVLWKDSPENPRNAPGEKKEPKAKKPTSKTAEEESPSSYKSQHRSSHISASGPPEAKSDDDSATEISDDEQLILKKPSVPTKALDTYPPAEVNHSMSNQELSKEAQKRAMISDSPPPPAGPPVAKKAKRAASCTDSEESDNAGAGPSTRRGVRQPIKRGGRRF